MEISLNENSFIESSCKGTLSQFVYIFFNDCEPCAVYSGKLLKMAFLAANNAFGLETLKSKFQYLR